MSIRDSWTIFTTWCKAQADRAIAWLRRERSYVARWATARGRKFLEEWIAEAIIFFSVIFALLWFFGDYVETRQ